MSRMTRVGLLAGATALTVTGVSVASPAVEGNDEALRAEIQRLSARVAELEGRNTDNWLTEKRTDEIRGIVHDVLADADTRASLLGSGMAAGYNDGFTISSADGNYMLRINGQLQTRWIYNYQSDGGANGDRHRSGFENTRSKLWFSGHIVNPQWGYMIEYDFGRTGSATLLDAYLSYDYGNGITIRMGQMKLPFMGENLIDSRYQQAIERSLLSRLFGLGGRAGRSNGLAVDFEQDMFRFTGMVSNGAGEINSMWNQFDTEWALTGRAEILAAGTWDQFTDFRSPSGDPFGLMVGVAAHWEHTEYGVLNTFKEEIFGFTVDANAQFGGFNLYGAFVWTHVDEKDAGSFDPMGLLIQGGFHFHPDWELYARYEWADFDANIDDLNIVTVGVNHYFAGHNAKASLDLGYSFKTIGFTDSRTGWLADSPNDDGQMVIRTQLQLAF